MTYCDYCKNMGQKTNFCSFCGKTLQIELATLYYGNNVTDRALSRIVLTEKFLILRLVNKEEFQANVAGTVFGLAGHLVANSIADSHEKSYGFYDLKEIQTVLYPYHTPQISKETACKILFCDGSDLLLNFDQNGRNNTKIAKKWICQINQLGIQIKNSGTAIYSTYCEKPLVNSATIALRICPSAATFVKRMPGQFIAPSLIDNYDLSQQQTVLNDQTSFLSSISPAAAPIQHRPQMADLTTIKKAKRRNIIISMIVAVCILTFISIISTIFIPSATPPSQIDEQALSGISEYLSNRDSEVNAPTNSSVQTNVAETSAVLTDDIYGSWDGTVYNNHWANLRFVTSGDWSINDSSLQPDDSGFYELVLVNELTGQTMSFGILEPTSVADSFSVALTTEDDLLESFKNGIESSATILSSTGPENRELCGNTYRTVDYLCEVPIIESDQVLQMYLSAYFRKIDNRFFYVTISSLSAEANNNLAAQLQSAE